MKIQANKTILYFLTLVILITSVIIALLLKQNSDLKEQLSGGQGLTQTSEQNGSSKQPPKPTPEPTPEPPVYYIALGDSVAYGYGVAEDDRYTDLLFEKLKEKEIVNQYKNLSKTGFTTGLLLHQLNNLSVEEQEAFKAAKVITINIGGNNILQPLIGYLPDFQEITDMLSEAAGIAVDAMGVAAEIDELSAEWERISTNFSFADLLRIGEFFNRASSILDNSIGMFERMNELNENNPLAILSGPLPPALVAEMEKGIVDFTVEFGKIISWLKENAPDAVLVVNTLYNPIPDEILGLQLELAGQAEIYTQAINEVILLLHKDDYHIVDVYGLFAGIGNLSEMMNYHLDLSQMNLNFDIIHPNGVGHKRIAELNFMVLGY